MFKTVLPGGSFYDEKRNLFIDLPDTPVTMEHSLLSISKWESIWLRSFFNDGPKTNEEWQDYIRCMTITPNVNPTLYKIIPPSLSRQIQAYCVAPMTATTINRKTKPKPYRKILTSEVVYYWMIQYCIPFECEKWHINRLMMLIEVCGEKANAQKETPAQARARTRELNAARRAKH